MWPSAVALSRWLLFNPEELEGKKILELGAGCGLVGLVAARLVLRQRTKEQKQQSTVAITDFNELVVKNVNQNIRLNGVEDLAEGVGLDFFHQDVTKEGWIDSAGNLKEQVDLVLAADVICQPEDAFAAARSIKASLRWGGKAITVSGDLKHRYGVECFEQGCTDLGLKVTKQNVGDLYGGKLISSNMEKTSGYVEGMSLSMFIVEKILR
jgi:predicted nicotinamide N-methyase